MSRSTTTTSPSTSTRLAYERSGRGRPLVLLHALGADRTSWLPVLPYLRDRRELICVDLPGFGGSPPLEPGRPATPGRLADAVVGLLRELGLDGRTVHLAGNSLGGWVALEAAAAGHAASVSAIAPAGLWARPLTPKPQIGRRLARIATPALERLMKSVSLKRLALASAVAHPDRVPPAQAAAFIRAYASAPAFAAVNRAMRAGMFTSLGQIDVPVTLIWPEHDRLVARPQSVPPGVSERLLTGCGHVPMWDDPQAVASALLFASRRYPDAGG